MLSLSDDQGGEAHLYLHVLMQTDTTERRRGSGERDKFHYYLPFVGLVCRPSFARCVGVSPLTLQRYKKHVRDGSISVKAHGNMLNKNAAKVNLVWLVKWFKNFAAEVGEVVPVKVRMQKTKDGVVKRYYTREMYTLLPATFTWDAIYDEMVAYVNRGLRVFEPARSTMGKLLQLHCPNIRIRAAQSNVCDLCTIYQSRMRTSATADQTEELGQHTESARRMRRECKKDKATCKVTDGSGSDVAVIVMDFSQNLTIPSVTATPSQWYFCSLLAVNVFGIYYENDGTQTNYLYDETTSGKGSDQINSMLHHFIRTVVVPSGKKKLVLYADNCSGQNKNNNVVRFLLAQVQMGTLDHVDYKFFDSAASNTTVHISRGNDFFKSYKPLVAELYKKLSGIQQYQFFSMNAQQPGVVQCRKGPNDAPVLQDLRRKIDGRLTESDNARRKLTHFLEDLPSRP
ncbi:hypothetical protein PHMEG_00035740 [Phytophthora megakarya]|uniref:Uncharacterized protein n=1 Tax=Phytophthora megakarya TaxID=4795 RepID=A0A225UNK6_9STRA|nr:hypothetical protein PHMEG_00035740 [Phytophthora megakarya]